MTKRFRLDHTQVDLLIIDDAMKHPSRQAIITVCVDAVGRQIVGSQISFRPPSFQICSRALNQALRKVTRKAKGGER